MRLTTDPEEIFDQNCLLMEQADIGMFNLTPFRGPSADAGTVFELGFLFARAKAVYGYSSTAALYAERVARSHGPLEDGRLYTKSLPTTGPSVPVPVNT